jgi:hypothetical protein
VERCLSDGTGWAVDETCADACVDAACVEVVCAAGESFCDGDTLRTCNADGTASTATKDCPAGCLPTLGGADCQQCEAGTKGCTEAGHAWQCVHPTQPPAETACAPGLEACVAGGCAGLLAWTIGDTETDAMLWLAIHTAACALDGAAAGADHLCWAIDTTKLQAPITAAGFNGWLCGGVESGTAGCTGAPQLALPSDTLETGHPVGDLCESYVQASSTVVVGPCP